MKLNWRNLNALFALLSVTFTRDVFSIAVTSSAEPCIAVGYRTTHTLLVCDFHFTVWKYIVYYLMYYVVSVVTDKVTRNLS